MRRFLVCVLVLVVWSAKAQEVHISGHYNSLTFEQFVKKVEEQTRYRFFYQQAVIDSIRVNVNVSDETIGKVLGDIFKDRDIHFSTYKDYIYVTGGRQLYTDLPLNFFNDGRKLTHAREDFDFSEFERREKIQKQAEERVYIIGKKTSDLKGNATIEGTIKDAKSGESVVGTAIFIEKPNIGTTSDQFGHFSITIPKGKQELRIQSVGYKTTRRQVMLYGNGKLDIELEEDVKPLKEVLIESDRDARVTGNQMGVERLDIKTMKQMPLALGETDIMKVVMALPGVQSVGEGTVGLNVRGGATNQNLILFNDAVVYNPSHLFGFFSTFNPDVLKNVELYKSGITADYGGRLSSVLDVHSREGNLKKLSGSGGISPVTGRLTLEGPIIKDRTSFLIGARSTYSDWILHQLNSKTFQNSSASFYDLTASLSHKINDNNNLYASGYMSKDRFRLNSDTTYSYSDRNASLKWKHVFNAKLYSVISGGFSRYNYTIGSDNNPVNAFSMTFQVKQINAKADFTYFLNSRHNINFGATAIRYSLSPGNLQPSGSKSLIVPDVLQNEQGVESAAYIGDNFEYSPKLSFYYGIRYSMYEFLGPKDVYQYTAGAPLETGNIRDTVHYASGKPIAKYGGAEPRVSARYLISNSSSIKLSYNRMRQYIQMLSNTTAITPTDIWKLSDNYIKPQYGDQISLGYYKNFRGNLIETSIETYYKMSHNVADYKGGAVLLLNHHLETDVLNARGKAYGIEFLVKKSSGKLNGWVSYTYSRSFLQTNGTYSSEIINNGKYYPSNYDKPHAVNFIGNYKFSRRINFSMNLIYSTGRPITLPVAKYYINGDARVYYSDRNQYRIPDYFRSDISINVEGNHKIRKLAHSSWTFAVYNLTGRHNAYSVFYTSQNGSINGYKLSIFARPIPTVTYNFKF